MTTAEVAKAAGLTIRQVQHWSDTGLLKPKAVGGDRSFSDVECLVACVVAAFRRKGVGLKLLRRQRGRIRKIAENFSSKWFVLSGMGILEHFSFPEHVGYQVSRVKGPCWVVKIP